MNKVSIQSKIISILLIASMIVAIGFELNVQEVSATTAITASAQVNYPYGAVMRKKATVDSGEVILLNDDTVVTVNKEIFTKTNSASKTNRWYYVSALGKNGYVRADLLDNWSYSPVTGTVTSAVNYRSGAGTGMKKKGTLKAGDVVTILLRVREKASENIWYKVAIGNGKYYLSSKYISLNNVAPVVTTTTTTVTNQTITTSDAAAPAFSCAGITYPTSLGVGTAFALKGTIKSSQQMSNAIFGVTDTNGNWVTSTNATINDTSFNIADVDAKISFGSLPAGTYYYRGDVYVDGKGYTQVLYQFVVNNLSWPQKIANVAIALAWPKGTSSSKYAYGGGSATSAFNVAINAVYPSRSNWSAGPRAGASCDVFVGTVIRYSGYDTEMPRGLDEDWKHLPNSPKWVQIPYNYDTSVLQPGDVIIYKRTDGGGHIMIYVEINGKGCLAEASLNSTYGHINTSTSKITKSSNKVITCVFRATS